MPAIARHGDLCGGGTLVATAARTFVNKIPVVRLGDQVTSHGDGAHSKAVMVEASASVFAEGLPVCRLGDKASCGHAVTTASADSFAG